MLIFSEIVLSTLWIVFGLFGVGVFIKRTDAPAAALVRGWAIFLFLCSLPWFFAFPARWIAPILWIFTILGVITASRALPRRTLLLGMIGCAAVAAVFALPFLIFPHLLAYAHWGTDQWGYASVAKWLVRHSVNELPTIDNRPGLDWVWFMLKLKDRPLTYLTLAATAGTFGYSTMVAYYVLPAALMASIFLAFFLEDRPFGFAHPAARLFLSLGVALQPVILVHFQHQFIGGVADSLVMMLLVVGIIHVQARDPGDPYFYAFALLLMVFSIGLYTVTVALVGMGLIAVVFLWSQGKQLWRLPRLRAALQPRLAWVGFGAILIGSSLGYFEIRRLVYEQVGTPIATGRVGHPWVQLGSLFGQTALTPWYAGDDAPGWLNPIQHNPPGGNIRVVLLAALLLLLVIQSSLWLWRRKDIAVGLVFAVAAVVLFRLMPPRGDHWLVGRALPTFGEMLLMVAAAGAIRERSRWLGLAAGILVCLPFPLAVPGLSAYLTKPVNLFLTTDGKRPPQDEAWHALAYAYFFEDRRTIDWSAAPSSFQAMTHYMPEDIRPKLKK